MNPCRACGQSSLEPLVDLGESPALTGALLSDPESARGSRRGRLRLSVCRGCSHVENTAFVADLVDYDGDYDNSLHFSPAIRSYTAGLAGRLVEAHGLEGKHVVEIGSGRGDFLVELCGRTGGTGTGYDPTCRPEADLAGVEFVVDHYRPGQDLGSYDLLVCRHVLEHLDDPEALLLALRSAAPAEAVLYLEVPAAEFGFAPAGMWDCIYPHVSYFSQPSLEALVRRCGFEVITSGSSFGEQFLWVELRAGTAGPPDLSGVPEHLARVQSFAATWSSTVFAWRERLEDGGGFALWGAGAKGVTFLNAVDADRRMTVVDLNPRKWGRYLPGTGHEVRSPQSLGPRTRAVLITNPAYHSEIAAQLADLGLPAAVIPV